MKIKRMQSIILALCNFHHIRIQWKKNDDASWCWQQLREIRVAPIKGKLDFWIALHEIGHIVADVTGVLQDYPVPIYMCEYVASVYALNMMAQLGIDLTFYREHARRYQVSVIAESFNKRELKIENIHPDVVAFCGIDFSEWKRAKSVRVVKNLKRFPHSKYPMRVYVTK